MTPVTIPEPIIIILTFTYQIIFIVKIPQDNYVHLWAWLIFMSLARLIMMCQLSVILFKDHNCSFWGCDIEQQSSACIVSLQLQLVESPCFLYSVLCCWYWFNVFMDKVCFNNWVAELSTPMDRSWAHQSHSFQVKGCHCAFQVTLG